MALVFTTGFLAVFGLSGAALPDREITARFPCGADLGTIGRNRFAVSHSGFARRSLILDIAYEWQGKAGWQMTGRSRLPIMFLITRAGTALSIVARSFIAYFSRPRLAANPRTGMSLSPLMVGLCLLALSFTVTAMLGILALPLLLMDEAAPSAQLQQVFSQSIPSVVLAVIILGPMIEEIIFRGWLSGTWRAIFGSALFVALALGGTPLVAKFVHGFGAVIQLSLATLGLAALRLLSPIDGGKRLPHFERVFPYLFWAQGLIFGILHFRNVAASSSVIAILSTLPLVVCAWLWGYARIVIGLKGAVLLHAAYNVPALLGALAWMILHKP